MALESPVVLAWKDPVLDPYLKYTCILLHPEVVVDSFCEQQHLLLFVHVEEVEADSGCFTFSSIFHKPPNYCMEYKALVYKPIP